MKKAFILPSIILCISLISSCEREDPQKNPEVDYVVYESSQGKIGQAGGQITVSNTGSKIYGASITIPEGALNAVNEISINESTDIFYIDSSAIMVSFLPEGLVFDEPVEIGLPFKGTLSEDVGLYYFDPDSDLISEIPVTRYDEEKGVVYGQIKHFSKFLTSKYGIRFEYKMMNIDGRVGTQVTLKGAGSNIGLKWVPTKLSHLISTGKRNVWASISTYESYSIFQVSLYKDGFFFNESEDVVSMYVKSDGKSAEVYRYFGGSYNEKFKKSDVQIKDFAPIFEDDYLGVWMSGMPLIFVFDEMIPDINKKYFVKVKWTLSPDEEGFNLTNITPIFEHSNKDESVRFSSMESYLNSSEPLCIHDDYEGDFHVKLPVANFTANKTNITVEESVQFTDQSSNSPTSWSWNFGDGSPLSSEQNPSHSYQNTGTYTVKLTVANSKGSDTRTESGYITVSGAGDPPVANFSANKTAINEGEQVVFTDQSTNTPTSWSWDFGDGGTSTLQNPSHTYTTADTYTVSLTSSNGHGSDVETKSNYITVSEAGSVPIANFTASQTSITENQSVQFTDQSTNSPTSWSWDFGDGILSVMQNPSHTYSTAGTYTVSLTSSNGHGSDTETKTNLITVSESGSGGETGTVTDYDGNTYNTIKIGSQWWMAENLKTTHYADGTAIPHIESASGWDALDYTDKAYCWYDNSTSNRDAYGGLYTWAAAMNGASSSDSNPSGIQGVCPAGWHLPSDAEWKHLEMHLGMSQSQADGTSLRGTDEGGKLKETGTLHWNSPNTGATNESGFTARPGGGRFYYGSFSNLGERFYFCAATEYSSSRAWIRYLGYDYAGVRRSSSNKNFGYSVRCVRD